MRQRRATQADIARELGVSQATVSLVLNNRTENLRISPETVERVREAIALHGYVPNLAARTLAGQRNAIIGVYTFESVFPTDGDDFYFPFLVGIEKKAEELGLDLLMFTSGGDRRRIYRDGQTRLSLADGSLLLGRNPGAEQIERLRDEGYPFVYIGHREVEGDPISYVAGDYAGATRDLTQRVIDLGHSRFAYARLGDGARQPARDREQGFRASTRSAGIPASSAPVWNLGSLDEVPSVLEDARSSGITALLVEQQRLAESFFDTALAKGISVPGDISIAVLGDAIDARRGGVEWTGFTVPGREMGATALDMLMQILDKPSDGPLQQQIACPINAGTTVAAPAGARK